MAWPSNRRVASAALLPFAALRQAQSRRHDIVKDAIN